MTVIIIQLMITIIDNIHSLKPGVKIHVKCSILYIFTIIDVYTTS